MLAVRSNGAALASLLGQPKQRRRPARSHHTLAEALGDSDELKSLGEIMALGAEVTPHDGIVADTTSTHPLRPTPCSPFRKPR